jgi:ATP-dependent DNA helicase UvrD/PcrA
MGTSETIAKPYEPYPPRKGRDSAQYPRIQVVQTSVQTLKANYFGRYIAEQIDAIPAEEIAEAQEEGYPTVLVIGPSQYLRQVRAHLEANTYQCEAPGAGEPVAVRREEGLVILRAQAEANLGWRILLETDTLPFRTEAVRVSIADRVPLIQVVPPDYRDRILAEAQAYEGPPEPPPLAGDIDRTRATIRFASFEGSKGLSAQHVFVVGLHEGDLPRRTNAVNDLEVCKMIVAITRTRKQCHLLYTRKWANREKRPSPFLAWIRPERRAFVKVTQEYWQRR